MHLTFCKQYNKTQNISKTSKTIQRLFFILYCKITIITETWDSNMIDVIDVKKNITYLAFRDFTKHFGPFINSILANVDVFFLSIDRSSFTERVNIHHPTMLHYQLDRNSLVERHPHHFIMEKPAPTLITFWVSNIRQKHTF